MTPLGDNTAFRWLLAGRAVDSLGNAVQPIAIWFAVLGLFDSITSLGVIVGATVIGQVLLLLVGGVVADRLPRSVVLVWSNVVAAVAQFAMVALIVGEVRSVPALVVLGFITGAASAFDGPATVAVVPEIVADGHLQQANSGLATARTAGRILGAPIAGILVATIGPGQALAINAASYLVAAYCFGHIGSGSSRTSEVATSPLTDLADGWREFVARSWVVVVVVSFFVINAALDSVLLVLGVAVADETIGPGGWGVALGLGLGMGWLLPAMLISGMALVQFGVAWDTSLQQHIPADRLARVASIDAIGSFAAIPVGTFAAGPLAAVFGARTVVLGAAAVVAVVALLSLLSGSVRGLASTSQG